jgi:hypothetical protein
MAGKAPTTKTPTAKKPTAKKPAEITVSQSYRDRVGQGAADGFGFILGGLAVFGLVSAGKAGIDAIFNRKTDDKEVA